MTSSESITVRELSLERAAAAIGIHWSTLRKRIAQGRLPEAYQSDSGRWYIPETAIARSQACSWAVRGTQELPTDE